MPRRLKVWIALAAVFAAVLVGCDASPRAEVDANKTDKAKQSDAASVAIDSASYRYDREIKFELYDLSSPNAKPIGGAIVSPLVSGGQKDCCINLPKQWRPGLKVRVEWGEADREILPEKYSRELDIPRYEQPADLFVVFYPEHEVEVVVSAAEPGHPEWKGRIKQTPWDYCVATAGRKACKAALPKFFSPEESRGFCTYVNEEKLADAETLCLSATLQCTREYDDEVYCKSVLWGARRP